MRRTSSPPSRQIGVAGLAFLGVFVGGMAPNFITKPPSRPMLIVDLLRHTSGLTYGFMQRNNVDAAYRAAKIGESCQPEPRARSAELTRMTSAAVLPYFQRFLR